MSGELILLVDDEPHIVELARLYLERDGFRTTSVGEGPAALRAVEREAPALMVLDVMLPQLDGFEVCRRVRAASDLPIIMLTARDEDIDKILGLELGADDYLTKPFNPREVVARVRAILRRATTTPVATHVLQVRGLLLDVDQHTVTIDGQAIETTPTEFALLKTLMENPNRAFTRGELIEKALGYSYEGLERTLDSHVKNLRKKIENDPTAPQYIETVFGVGYRLNDNTPVATESPKRGKR